MSFSLFYFFFFSCSCALRDPHSFPTRRSSDLYATASAAMKSRPLQSASSAAASTAPRLSLGWHVPSERQSRSEEHTSELQSRVDLVCRLLLEKKKNKNKTEKDNENKNRAHKTL